jgi:hypothetical protein
MTGKIKIVGTNTATNFLRGQEDNEATLISSGLLHNLKFKGEEFLFDLKKTTVIENTILFWGWLSNEWSAGQICFEFEQKRLDPESNIEDSNVAGQ